MAQSSQSPYQASFSGQGSFDAQYRDLRPAPPPQQWNHQGWGQQFPYQPYDDEQVTLAPILSEQRDQPAQSSYHSFPRKTRATRACFNCRARKQKCDEGTPCEFCRWNDYECHYDDIPLRKQDLNVLMMERFDRMERRYDMVEKKFDRVERRFDRNERRFDRIEAKIDTLQADVDYLNQMLEFLVGAKEDEIAREPGNSPRPSILRPRDPTPLDTITSPTPLDTIMSPTPLDTMMSPMSPNTITGPISPDLMVDLSSGDAE